MMKPSLTLLTLCVVTAGLVYASGADRIPTPRANLTPVSSPPDALQVAEVIAPASESDEQAPAAQPIEIDIYSINAGGSHEIQAGDLTLGVSIAQPVVGKTTSGPYTIELGYWYLVEDAACGVGLTGDLNISGDVALSDVIYLVNYVLKAGPDPQPCAAAGDVNCSGEIALSDVIYLVNYVLKAGPDPCDVCSLIPATWSCP
jgi:hypothetical protein